MWIFIENIELKRFLDNNYWYIATKDFKTIDIAKTLIPELINKKINGKRMYK